MNQKLPTVAAFVVAVLIPASAQARAVEPGAVTASSGNVSATLDDGRLSITREGVIAFDEPIPDVACSGCELGDDALQLTDLDGDGEAEVIVTGATGGTTCCWTLGVWDYRRPTATYGELGFNTWAERFTLSDLEGDGIPEFVSGDDRFTDRFTSDAASFAPAGVYRYERPQGKPGLYDVTRDFPEVIRENARVARRHFTSAGRDEEVGGTIAAYVADQYLLGRGSVGLRELQRQMRRGVLGSPREARMYRTRLLKLLRKWDYR
jgi:hypothetical protein